MAMDLVSSGVVWGPGNSVTYRPSIPNKTTEKRSVMRMFGFIVAECGHLLFHLTYWIGIIGAFALGHYLK